MSSIRLLFVGIFLVALPAAFGSSTASAAVRTWVGLDVDDNKWTSVDNWNGAGSIPAQGDSVVFNNSTAEDCYVNTDVNLGNFTIQSTYAGTIRMADSGGTAQTTTNTRRITLGQTIFGASCCSGGTFTQAGGTFQAPNYFVVREINKTGGTFTHNSKTVVLSANGASKTLNFSGTGSFNNLAINDGLLGYWKLDETGALSTITDYSGHGNNLTAQNTPAADTSVPSHVHYNTGSVAFTKGSAKALALGSAVPDALKQSAWTISAWVKVTTLDGSGSEVLSIGNRSMLRLIAGTSTNVRAETIMYDGSSYLKAQSPDSNTATTGDGKWHHVVAVNTGTSLYAFLDGAVGSTTALGGSSQSFTSATSNVTIGAHADYSGSTAFEMDGSIDDVRFYGRALTTTEILALFAGGQPGTSAWTQTAGTAFTVSNDLIIGAGTFADGGQTITVSGSWFNWGGLFTGTGTVAMNSTGTEYIHSNMQWFNTLTLSTSGSGVWINRDILSVAGTLNLQSGTLQYQTNNERYKARFGNINQTGGTLDQNGQGGTMITTANASNTFTVTSNSTYISQFRFEAKGETGLVGYWKLDEQTGSTTYDTTSNANTGTLNGGVRWWNTTYDNGTLSSNVIGNLPQFFLNPGWVDLDGTDDYISVGTTNLPAPNASKSISLWVYYDATTAATQNFFSIVDTNAANNVHVGFRNSNVAVWKAGATDFVSAAQPAISGWRHVVYTFDATAGSMGTHKLYLAGALVDTETAVAPDGAGTAPLYATIGAYRTMAGSYAQFYDGRIDDVRVYNQVLTAAQVKGMSEGRWAGTGSIVTWTLGAPLSTGSFAVDAGTLDTSNNAITSTGNCTVGSGIWLQGNAITLCTTGATIYDNGKLTMNTAGAILKIPDTRTLTIDGTLEVAVPSGTKPIIQHNGSGKYTFKVGSSSTATPTLNVDGLTVRNTDTDGMQINNTAGAVTNVVRFDNVVFDSGLAATSGAALMTVRTNGFYMTGRNVTFDRNGMHATSYNVKVVGDGDITNGETRATFGNTTCENTSSAAESCEAADYDDDSGGDGVADVGCTSANAGCGVAQFIYMSYLDTAGTIAGFPTAAFDWNGFTYWKTYVAFNDINSAGTDRLYARNQDGSDAGYYWDIPAGTGNFVGTPRWDMEGSSHFVYVVTSLGYVYKIRDYGSFGGGGFNSTVGVVGAGWPYHNGGSATATSPLAMSTANLYWTGNDSSGNPKIFGVVRSSGAILTTPPALTSTGTSAPALGVVSGTLYIFAGNSSGTLYRKPDTLSGGGSITHAASAVTTPLSVFGGTIGLFYGDAAGRLRVVNPLSMGSVYWSYLNANGAATGGLYYHLRRARVYYGDGAGKMYAIVRDASTPNGKVLSAGYPYQPANSTTASDAIVVAPVHVEGVTAYGTSTGKVVFVDAQNNSDDVALMQMYHFGSAVSSISYEYLTATTGNFMIGTANGRLHLIKRDTADATTMRDPTSAKP